ncbi:hypothetical protein MMC14_003592 [Varicellaria rhodocarpa]|nr:hypothetical protein [Varicellaria rhodocarpa]
MSNLSKASEKPSAYYEISPYSEILNSETCSDSTSTLLPCVSPSKRSHRKERLILKTVFLVFTHTLLLFAGYMLAEHGQVHLILKQLAAHVKQDSYVTDISAGSGSKLQVAVEDLDMHDALTVENTTRVYDHHAEYVLDSDTADNFWMRIQPGAFSLTTAGGLVSINTQRALNHGLAISLPNPTHPDESIYQIAVYHSLHCLNRLRHRLFTPTSSTKFTFPVDITTDEHTVHCVDHIRHALTCHADVSLAETDDYRTWGKTQVHRCRDYDAVMDWTEGHALAGMPGMLEGFVREGEEED